MWVPRRSLDTSPEHCLQVVRELVILPKLLYKVCLAVLGIQEQHRPHQDVVLDVHPLLDCGWVTRLQVRQGQARATLIIIEKNMKK